MSDESDFNHEASISFPQELRIAFAKVGMRLTKHIHEITPELPFVVCEFIAIKMIQEDLSEMEKKAREILGEENLKAIKLEHHLKPDLMQ